MGRQHQGMDRPGVWQVPEGSGEQGKMEKTGCKIICGASTTLAVKGLIMMMMMYSLTLLAKLMVLHRQILFSLAIAAIAEAILMQTSAEQVPSLHRVARSQVLKMVTSSNIWPFMLISAPMIFML